jgi:hypothetical protein
MAQELDAVAKEALVCHPDESRTFCVRIGRKSFYFALVNGSKFILLSISLQSTTGIV